MLEESMHKPKFRSVLYDKYPWSEPPSGQERRWILEYFDSHNAGKFALRTTLYNQKALYYSVCPKILRNSDIVFEESLKASSYDPIFVAA